MPLNRDQPPEPNAKNATASVPTIHQHTRSIGSDLSLRSRPSTPQNEMNNTTSRRESVNSIPSDGGRRYHLNDDGPGVVQPAAKGFKMPAVDTMQKQQVVKSQHSISSRFQPPNTKQENLRASTTTAKTKRAEKPIVNSFDDTESLGPSILEDFPDDGQTTSRNRPQVEQVSERGTGYTSDHDRRSDRHDSLDVFVGDFGPDWAAIADDERRRLETKNQSLTPNTAFIHDNNEHDGFPPPDTLVTRLEGFQDPNTPTRTQSAPPVKVQLHTPAPRKNVVWADTNQFHNLSPSFRSSEMGKEDSFEQPISRPNSAQPRVQTISDQRVPRIHQNNHSQPRQGQSVLPSQADRFRHLRGHLEAVRPGGEKVSAPESDNQDFSEDEPTQTHQQYRHRDKPHGSDVVDPQSLPSRKRSHDDMNNELDYTYDELKKNNLSTLQAEAFTRDPRAGVQPPPTDSVGNEMTLHQILENLSKVPENAQRETFKNLTDEQWARTGQWFVDKFQADLRKLTEIRLQRRQIALTYEDAIRRRQRLVEHHEAEVDRELQELQTGGKQLVDGRKIPSGSRSGTPMKGGR